MAIRVARLDAMRDLTEQVHGLRLSAQTTVVDAVLQNDTTRASVDGTIRGARTVRINPVGRDTYEVVLELDRDMIARIMMAVR
ncbi:LPP20 family lipoprotein [Yoonia sp. TsM2_T14_4]